MRKTVVALVAAVLASGGAQAATIYQSNFGSDLSGFTTTGSAGLRTSNGTSYLGGLTLGSAGLLNLDTSGFTNISVSFDLYAIQSLDGDGPSGGGADPFNVTQDTATLFNYTFANFSGAGSQSYPAAGSAPKSGSYMTGLLGFGSGDFGDTEYHIAPLSLTSGNGQTTLAFIGNSNQGEGDESYGINNVVVSGTQIAAAVPEPSSWAMMIFGMGGVGGMLRRGRKAGKLAGMLGGLKLA